MRCDIKYIAVFENLLISSRISTAVKNNDSENKLPSRRGSKLNALRKTSPPANFFKRGGVLRFRYAIVQFRWFTIPSLYRSYDRSSNREQKDLPYGRYYWPEKSSKSSTSCLLLFVWNHVDYEKSYTEVDLIYFWEVTFMIYHIQLFIEDRPK